jgi:hypothetical protein
MTDATIPAPVRDAFAGKVGLSLSELAKALGWDEKTLRAHCRAGNLP